MPPKDNHSVKSQIYKSIKNSFKSIPFNLLAKQSGFKQREPKKLTAQLLFITALCCFARGSSTFQSWAEEIGFQTGKRVSRQGIWKRVNSLFSAFVYNLLNEILSQQMRQTHLQTNKKTILKKYNRVLVQDSTTIHLPQWLNKCYPGNYSRGEIKALLRIQIIFDLVSNKVIYFGLTPYCKNDQSMSQLIVDIAHKDDFVIRDLGYFVLESISDMSNKGVTHITRLKPGVKLYHIKTGKEIDLVKELKAHGKIDCFVLVGTTARVRKRLVVTKLPDEIANERVRKAKKDRNKRLNHSKSYYFLLGYTIYITNQTQMSALHINQIYGLRWRIEIIFKTWKSQLRLQQLIPAHLSATKHKVEALIYIMMVYIIKFQLKLYNQTLQAIKDDKININISLTKLSQLITNRFTEIVQLTTKKIINIIILHCSYDSRKDRENYCQNYNLS
jgi:hypothetical protein